MGVTRLSSPVGLLRPSPACDASRTEHTSPGEFCPRPGGDREPHPGACCGRCGARFLAADPAAGETNRALPQIIPRTEPPLPTLLRRYRDAHRQYVELERELADLDRQIVAAGRPGARPRRRAPTPSPVSDEVRAVLRVLQEAESPLPPREVASRLGVPPKTASRRIARAVHLGYVERAGQARYRVADAVLAVEIGQFSRFDLLLPATA